MEEIVKVENIKYIYPDKTTVSIKGLKLNVCRGERIALIGTNGSGKSTLLSHLIGLLEPNEGSIEVFGINPAKDFTKISRKVGVVVQSVENQLVGPTVFDDIAFSLINYGFARKEIEERVSEIIAKLKIEHLKDKIVHYLSGGEKKKVALAGALVLKPELLILDEALAELDPQATELVIKLLEEYDQKYNTAVIMATNDLNIVQKYAETVYLLEGGEITFKGTFDELLHSKKEYELCMHA